MFKGFEGNGAVGERTGQPWVGVLRFDFAGLGNSEGDFGTTNFSTNQVDLLSAVRFMEESGQAPQLLIGHSFGGAAAMSVAIK